MREAGGSLRSLLARVAGTELMARIARGALVAMVLLASGTAVRYVAQVLFARWMGPVEYGAYAFAYSWATLLAVAAALGLPTGVLRFAPQYLSDRDWTRFRALANRSRALVLAAGVVLAIAASAFVLALAHRNEHLGSLVLAMWLIPLLAVVNLQAAIIRGARRIDLSYGPTMLMQPSVALLGASLVVLLGIRLSGALLLGLAGVSLILVAVVQLIFIARLSPPGPRVPRSAGDTRLWLTTSLPLLLVAGSLVVLNQSDILMLGILVGPQAAGQYAAATKTAALVSFLLLGVNAIAAPMISELHGKKDLAQLQTLVTNVTRWVFWPSLLVTVALAVAGRQILGVFGHAFVDAYGPLVVLSLGQLVNASVGPVGFLLNLTGHQLHSARVYAVSAALNVVLNLILIPLAGLLGAALATATTMALWNLWLSRSASARLGIESFVFVARGGHRRP